MEQKTEQTTEQTTEQKTDSVNLTETMTTAVCYTTYGDPGKNLKILALPIPKVGRNEVLVKVHAASLNPIDYKIAEGWFQKVITKKFPAIVGCDFSGVIVAVGSHVHNFKKGMKVAGQIPLTSSGGTWSHYITIPATNIMEIPEQCPFLETAALPLAGGTSYQALVEKGRLQKGNKVLILGGNTACGLFAIQIAKAFEASRIIATCSSREEELKKLGCTDVINYKNEQWSEKLKGENIDIIYDTVGGLQSWEKAPLVLKKNGYFVTIVGDSEHGSNDGLLGFARAVYLSLIVNFGAILATILIMNVLQ